MREGKKRMAQGQGYHIDLKGYKILLSTDDGNKKKRRFFGMLFTDAWLKILEIK
jgi:hypothetical protein